VTAGESGAVRIWDAGPCDSLSCFAGTSAPSDALFTRRPVCALQRRRSADQDVAGGWRPCAVEIAAHRGYAIAASLRQMEKPFTAGGDLTARVWTPIRRLLSTLRGHAGDLLRDGRLARWPIHRDGRGGPHRSYLGQGSREPVRVLQDTPAASTRLPFSRWPQIVTAGEDHAVILWDAKTGARRATYRFPERILARCVFSGRRAGGYRRIGRARRLLETAGDRLDHSMLHSVL